MTNIFRKMNNESGYKRAFDKKLPLHNKYFNLDTKALAMSFQYKLRKKLEENFILTHTVFKDDDRHIVGNSVAPEFIKNNSIFNEFLYIENNFSNYVELDYSDIEKSIDYIFEKYLENMLSDYSDEIVKLSKGREFFVAPPLAGNDFLWISSKLQVVNSYYIGNNGVHIDFFDIINPYTGVRSFTVDMLVGFSEE